MVIVSTKNPLVRELSSLKEKKVRKERGSFLVEGEKMVREAVQGGMQLLRIAVREDYTGSTYGFEPIVLGSDAFKFVADEKSPQGILAEVRIPDTSLRPPKESCLLLDGVSDPANVGAILRTANAAGYEEIYLVDCADPYSPKSVRASMSGVFFTRIMTGTREEVLSVIGSLPLIAADMSGENVFAFRPPEKFCLCVGNEGNGLSKEVFSKATYTVRIPMRETAESLNAAVSASIIMYCFKQKIS